MRNYYPTEQVASLLNRCVMVAVQQKDYSTFNLVNETFLDDDGDYACVVLVTKQGEEVELFKKSPFDEAETFFYKYLDECKARGNEPVITYCSYD